MLRILERATDNTATRVRSDSHGGQQAYPGPRNQKSESKKDGEPVIVARVCNGYQIFPSVERLDPRKAPNFNLGPILENEGTIEGTFQVADRIFQGRLGLACFCAKDPLSK
ncbi:hypothetical protein V8E54_011310 [Elaphomyces granulatus]